MQYVIERDWTNGNTWTARAYHDAYGYMGSLMGYRTQHEASLAIRAAYPR